MARSYLKQIAEGLSYCHSHGVLHRWEGDCPAVTLIYHASSSSLVKRGTYLLAFWLCPSITLLSWSRSVDHQLAYCVLCVRDMKPQNLLVDYDGHIKLADFGLARTLKMPIRSVWQISILYFCANCNSSWQLLFPIPQICSISWRRHTYVSSLVF